MAKRKSYAKVEIVEGVLVFKWSDDKTLAVDPSTFPEEIQAHAMCHGFKQKLMDSYGAHPDVSDCDSARDVMEGVIANLLDGKWNARAESGGGIWVEALARVKETDIITARTAWKNATDAQRKALQQSAKMLKAKADILAERAAAAAAGADDDDSADDILDGIM